MPARLTSQLKSRESTSRSTETLRRCLCGIALVAFFGAANLLRAQDHTVLFSVSDPGVTKAITNWGMGTVGGHDVMRNGLIYMGADQIDIVVMPFPVWDGITNGQISLRSKQQMDYWLSVANLAGSKPIALSTGTGDGVNPWYITGLNQVNPARWAECLIATKQYLTNRTVAWAQPFNEPDYGYLQGYGWNQGSPQNLYDIMGILQNDPSFSSTLLGGGAVLNANDALAWYDPIKTRAQIGSTHCISGNIANYANFINAVKANGDLAYNPELHTVAEAIVGAEYGMDHGTWWLRADLTRSDFVKACQGKRLAYVEDRARWTAAAVYRATNGAVKAFLGGAELEGQPTTYRFFSKDRDVFYNGDGPRRDFTVSTAADKEQVVNITWSADVPPVINGRYIVVNRNSGKVMEVAGTSTAAGANIQQNTYAGGTHQQWDITPYAATYLDQSYFAITAAHSGKAADVNNFSYNNGGNVMQWDNLQGLNQHWFFEYAGDGYFCIRSRWSGLCLDVDNFSTANGANIQQWTLLNGLNQQWRLIPVGAAVEFIAPPVLTGVTATPNALSVRLNWNASAAADLAGYTVLRATNSGGPYEIVARDLTNNSFTDKSANQPRTYFYVVRAVDRSLNNSANSTQVSATPTVIPAAVVRYSFNGNTNDSSGNANHPIVTVGSPAYVAGQSGSAMDQNGTSQYTMLPANLLASITNFTIALWVNWDGGAPWQRIFDFGNDPTQYMFLTPSSGAGTLRFAITTSGGGGEQILQTSPLPVGQWRHVAVTRNGNTAKLYTNGVVAATSTITIAPASFNPALNYLGKSQYPDPLFNGRLDELFIYNYALSDSEIARLAANLPPPPTVPTSMTTAIAGNALLMSWPSNYVGCRLESNSVSLTAPGSWFTVSGSAATNQMAMPINASSSNVFFRLVYP